VRASLAAALLAGVVAWSGQVSWTFLNRARQAVASQGDRPGKTQQSIEAFIDMGRHIPPGAAVGYWVRPAGNSQELEQLQGIYFQVQRGLAPRVLEPERDQRWIVLIGLDPATIRQEVARRSARPVHVVGVDAMLVERQP
jgi:hypothetical protein